MRLWRSLHPFQDSDLRRDRRRELRARARRRAPLGRRELALERVEARLLLTSGPQLISIIPDTGGLLLPGETLNVAPQELTFRFNQGEVINPATLSGIELVRSGGDGVFGNANDVAIAPGFIGVDATQSNEVELRFSAPLPDDLYRITIVGAGANALTDTGNLSTGGSTPPAAFNGGVNYSQQFRLDLAPQVLAVVPEPFSAPVPGTGVKVPLTNQIQVYFNEALNPTSAKNPAFYQLIQTQNTSTTADDGAPILPQSVAYTDTPNPDGSVTHEAVLTFAQPLDSYLAQDAATNTNLTNPTTGVTNEAFRLRIGNTNQPLPPPAVDTVPTAANTLNTSGNTSAGSPTVSSTNTSGMSAGDMVAIVGAGPNGAILYSTIASINSTTQFTLAVSAGTTTTAASVSDFGKDPGNTFNTAMNAGTLSGQTQILTSAIEPMAVNPDILYPGGAIGPGIRNIPIENHLQDGTSTPAGGVTTVYYNFQNHYGTDPSGKILSNQILNSPQQMQDVRDIMGLFANYSGAKFVETTSATSAPAGALNITVVTGDIRAVQPSIPATSQNGIEGSTALVSTAAIVNGNVNWGTSAYGGSYFVMAMHEIAHALGLGDTFELPVGNVQGTSGSENPNQVQPTPTSPAPTQPPEPMYPNYGDISTLDYLYLTDSSDVNLYKFQVTTPGVFRAETFAQRLTPTSLLNTELTLYDEINLLGVPANGGQDIAATQAALGTPLTFTVNDPTHPAGGGVTFEFNAGYSLRLPIGATGASLNGKSFTLGDGNETISFQFTTSTAPPAPTKSTIYIVTDATDAGDTLAGELASAINFEVKNFGLGSGISATFLPGGSGVVNIGGTTATAFNDINSGVLRIGSVTAQTPGALLVRYAPADSQHQLAIDITAALNADAFNATSNPGGLNLTATAELNQVQIQGPVTIDSSGTTFGGVPLLPATIERDIVSRNDNYYGQDSFINLPLTPGNYYVAVSASGNTEFDPNVPDSGWGGTSNGAYELHLNFQPDPTSSLVSLVSPAGTGLNVLGGDTAQPLDGDPNSTTSSSGTGGSAYNFWFNVTDTTNTHNGNVNEPTGDTFYVDKTQPTVPSGPVGSYTHPFPTIAAALASGFLLPGTDLRIEGDLPTNFANLTPAVQQQDLLNAPSYDIGTENFAHQNATLPDGATFNVPRGVTVMIDAGAIFKFRQSWIDVGSSAVTIDRSEGAVQVLGIPGDQAIFTSLNDTSVSSGTSSLAGDPVKKGDWGGIFFHQDSDLAPLGIFLNYVDEAKMQFGGGQVQINGQATVVDPVQMATSRPTITNNTILDSSDAAFSGTPNSFEDTVFQRDITITALSGAQITNGQTFQIHGQSFEFDNNPGNQNSVLPGDVPIFFHATDSANQIAVEMAEAINGAQLSSPDVQAAVTGAQLTLTNTQIDSPIAINTVLGGLIPSGWSFAVNGVVFEFNNGGKLLNANAVPIVPQSGNDTQLQVAQDIAKAINQRFIDNGNGQIVYAQAVALPNNQARVDLMNTSDVNLSLANTGLTNPGLTLNLISPMSINVAGDVNPATGLLNVVDGQSFTVNGTVFELDSGYTLIVPPTGALGINNGDQFGLSDGVNTITFVFYKSAPPAPQPHQVQIQLGTNDSADVVAADIVNAINNSGLANIFARSLGSGLGQVNLGGNSATSFLTGSGTITLKLGQAGDVERPGTQISSAIAVPFYPTMTAAQLAAAIGAAVSSAGIGVSANVVTNGLNQPQPQVAFQNVTSLVPNPSALDVSGELQASGSQAGMLYALDGQSFTLNGKVFEFDSGYTLQAPANGGAGLAPGDTFSLGDGNHTVKFVFYTTTAPALEPNNQVGIKFAPSDTSDMVAAEIANAINIGVSAALGFSLGGISATPLGHGTGQVNIGGGFDSVSGIRLASALTTVFSPGSGQITAMGQPGAQIAGAFAVPFIPFDPNAGDPALTAQLATSIATAINDAAIGVVAKAQGSLVLFQHAASLVTNATLGTRSPLAVQTDPVFIYGADALPLALTNNFYTADYGRVGPDVHGNTLAVNLTPVINTVSAGSIANGQQFIVNNQGFQFVQVGGANQSTAPGFVPVSFKTTDNAAQVAQDIITAINNPSLGLGVNAVIASNNSSQVVLYGTKYDPNGSLTPSNLRPFGAFNVNTLNSPLTATQAVDENTINGLFVHISTLAGQSLDTLGVPATFNATDITYVLGENLIIDGQPGGPLGTTARESARLTIDPGVVVKLAAARIEVQPGGTLIAEGDTNHQIIFTSLADDTVGSGGTLDTNGNGKLTQQKPGDWGGFFFWPTSQGSLDNVLIEYGGGRVPDEGGFDNFNAVEIYQATVRITNSTLQDNAGGLAASTRDGRGTNTVAASLPNMGETIFVIGAQPVLVNNVINDNVGAAISIDASSLTDAIVPDWGRSTGVIDRFSQFDNNDGPLVRLNTIGNVSTNAAINGMVVRGGVLTTDSVWDDTDIVHVLLDSIQVPNSTTLRLQSTATNSLVVKLNGGNAGFDATGTPLDISNRIGGAVQVLGTPQHPVVLTSFTDGTVGAGLTPSGQPGNNTSNGNAGSLSVSVGANVNITKDSQNEAETTISVNPTNPLNLWESDTVSGTAHYSLNGGKTWFSSDLSALPTSDGDVQSAWDQFGNLFITRFGTNDDIEFAMSTDGGKTFTDAQSVGAAGSDQPSIAVGPSGTSAPGSVWISFADPNFNIIAVGAPVSGLGIVGAFGTPETAPDPDSAGDFGNIAVGPKGQVMVTYQNNGSGNGPDTIKVNLDPDGLGPAGFGAAVLPTSTNVGGFSPIPPQPDRTIDAEANLAYDRSGGPHDGRVYLVYVDRPSTSSPETSIYVRYSDNNGATWSGPVLVNDDAVGDGKSKFMPAIAVDQTTGNVAVTWLDARNSGPADDTVQAYGSVSSDGGVSWLSNFKISQGSSNGLVAAVNSFPFNFGDYDQMAFTNGVLYRTWSDNSNSTGDNPAGSLNAFDTYTAEVTVSSTSGGASSGTPGSWNGITLDQNSNDTNVAVVNEAEPAYTGGKGTNDAPGTAQSLGELAPNPSSGDDNLRLGFVVNGTISPDHPGDIDTYTFKGTAGTQAFFDVGSTSMALDSVLELVDANGNVLARSDNAVAEANDPTSPNALSAGQLLTNPNYPGSVQLAGNLALPLQSNMFQDNVYPSTDLRNFGSINPLDPGFRLVLPGTTGTISDYYVRIYSKGATPTNYYVPGDGVSSGGYQLRIGLQELAQAPGSVVQYGDIRFASNGISVLGLPTHSPLLANAAQVPSDGNVTNPLAGNNPSSINQVPAQDLGNLLATDTSSLSVSGSIDSNNPTQVDWYKFELNYDLVQSISSVNAADKIFSTIFQVGYADGLTRPDTTISVFDANGNLILSGQNSNVADQQPHNTQGSDTANLSDISLGNNDPFIGSVELPAGVPAGASHTYYVAISSNATLPTAMDAYFNPNSSQPGVRLEPIEGVQRVVEDHVGAQGYTSGNGPVASASQGLGFPTQPVLPTAPNPILPTAASQAGQIVEPFTLSDVPLFVSTRTSAGSTLVGVNAASGNQETVYGTIGGFPTADIAMRTDGKLYAYQSRGPDASNAGQLVQVDPGNPSSVLTFPPDNIPDTVVPSNTVDALAFSNNNGLPDTAYNLFYSVEPDAVRGYDSVLFQANAPDNTGDPTNNWGKSLAPNQGAELGTASPAPNVAFQSATDDGTFPGGSHTGLPDIAAGNTFVLDDAVHPKQTFEYGSSVPELTINANATGASVNGETISVTLGGFLVGGSYTPPITRTFQFVIGNAAPAFGDIAISVNAGDTFNNLAAAAVGAINAAIPSGATPTATQDGNRIDFENGPTTGFFTDPGAISAVSIFPGAGGQITLANPVPEIDVSPSALGNTINDEEFLVRSGINAAIHVFQFVLKGQIQTNPNDTPIFVNPLDNAATLTADAVNAINIAFNAAVATQGVSPYTNRIVFVDDSTGISVNPPATPAGAQGELAVLNAPFIGGANIVPYTAGDDGNQLEFETINEINAVFGALGSRLWAYDARAVPPEGGVDAPPPPPIFLSGTMDIYFSVNADFSQITWLPEVGQGPGGYITGMAFDGGLMYGVSSNGGVYQIGGTQDITSAGILYDTDFGSLVGNDPSGIYGGFVDAITGHVLEPLKYLPASSAYVARQYAFEGLALAPQDIDLNGNGVPGQLAHDLFAISTPSGLNPGAGSVLVAFTDGQSARGAAGAPDSVFDTPINFQGQTVSTGAYQDFTTIPTITAPTGLAFSPLDVNLWHDEPAGGVVGPTDVGVNTTFDDSRQPATSGVWRFGLDSSNAGQMAFGANLLGNPAIANINNNPGTPDPSPFGTINTSTNTTNFVPNGSALGTYNLPGGAAGTLTALPFSLAGYSAADEPTLYFNYELNTRNSYPEAFKTSARVEISADGGKTWSELATNDSTRTAYNTANGPNGQSSELPQFWTASASVPTETDPNTGQPIVDPRQQTQEMFDTTGSGVNGLVWRQARVDLGNFAGDANLILRFDFSSSGTISIPSALQHEVPQGNSSSGVHIPGDQFGNPANPDRSQDNEHFGWAISDITVGLAGQGELVTNATPQTGFTVLGGSVPGASPPPNFNAPTQQLTGPYQLEIRPGQPIGQTQNENANPIIITQQSNINARMDSSYTLVAPDPIYNQTVPVPLNLPVAGALVGTMTFNFPDTPSPSGTGTLTFNAVGDLEGRQEYLSIDFPDLPNTPGGLRQQLQQSIYFDQRDKALQDQTFPSTAITFTQAQIQALIAANNANPANPRNVIHITVFPPPGTLVDGITSLSATLAYSAVAGSGLFPGDPNSILDGQTFQISDGLKTVTFEYDDNNQLNNLNDIRVAFNTNYSSPQLAQAIAAAINQPGLFNVTAATADAPSHATTAGANDTSNLVNLFGAAWVNVAPAVAITPSEPDETLASAVPVPLGFSQPTVTATSAIGIGPARQPGQPPQPFGTPSLDLDLYAVKLNVGQKLQVQVDTPSVNIVANGSVNNGTSPATFTANAGTLSLLNNQYLNQFLEFTSGVLIGEKRQVSGYAASSGTFTFTAPFSAAPAPGDTFEILSTDSGLDSYLRVFDANGNELQHNDDGPTPGKQNSNTDSFLTFFAPATGTYYFGVSGMLPNKQGNTSYNPVNDSGTQPGSTGPYTIDFTLLDATQVIKYDNAQGGTAVARQQGIVIVQDNRITSSSGDGVLATVPTGGVRNVPTLDTQQLVPGVVIENNVISKSGQAGIQFNGISPAAGQPPAAVPFGRIVNNTIVGGLAGQMGVGINVSNDASPTILNNIVANLSTGIQVDASSQALAGQPVLGQNIYQNNGTDDSIGSILEQGGIHLAASDPLFVNAKVGNFYLAKGSQAVDSALSSLQDRSAMTAVTGPLGIAPSPILAPSYDINGQLRIHDQTSTGGSGTGTQIFQDLGAIDRVDTTGPIATLLSPVDNGVDDQNPSVNFVHTLDANLAEFDIQINDGIGSGVDDSSVNVNEVTLRRNGVLLTPGFDYSFVYDNNNHIIRLIAASGIWQNGSVYDISIDNGVNFDPLQPSRTPTGIKDLAGNDLQPNSASGPYSGFTHFEMILDSIHNEPPALVVPLTTPSVFEHDTLVFTSNPSPPATPGIEYTTPITIFDVDANGGVEQVTLTAANGILQLDPTQMAGAVTAAGAIVTGNGTSQLTIKAVLGDTTVTPAVPGINTLLALLQYVPDPASAPYFAGPTTITVVANDLGNSPTPAQVTTFSLPITVIAVNNPPATSAPSTASGVEDTPITFSTAMGNPITVSDPDITGAAQANPDLSLKETLTAVEGTLTLATVAGLSNAATGLPLTVATGSNLTFTGSVSAINAALNGLTFTPVAEYSSNVSWAGYRIVFGGGATAAVPPTSNQLKLVKATEVDLLPGATGALINGQTFTVTVPVSNGETVTTTFEFDADGHATSNAKIVVLPGTLDNAYTLAIKAAAAIDAAYVFPVLGIGPVASNPGLSARDHGKANAANDAITLLLGATATVTTTATNPNLSVSNNGAEVDVAATATGATINGQTITVTLPSPTVPGQTYTAVFEFNDGTLTTNNISIPILDTDDAPALATEAAKAINTAFLTPLPTLGLVATDASAAAITIQTSDQGNVGVGPDHVTTPFPLSAPLQSIAITITPVNDNPLLDSGTETLQSINEVATQALNSGTQIAQMLATGANGQPITLRAINEGAKDGIAVTGFSDVTDGTWQYSLDGTIWTPFAANIAGVAQSGPSPSTNALLLDASDFVRFLPNPFFQTDSLNAPVDMFFYAWDETTAVDLTTGGQLSLIPGGTANLTTTGANPVGNSGSAPFSSTGAAAVLSVTAVNVSPPVVTAPTPPVGGFTTPENTQFKFNSPNLINVSDEDSNQGPQPSQVKLTISTDPATGTLLLGPNVAADLTVSGNTPPAGTATIILQGPYADVNAALNGLTFTPLHAYAGSATVTLVANDLGNFGSGGALNSVPQVINIQVVAVHQAPVLGTSPPFAQPNFPAIVENVPSASNPSASQIANGAYTIDTMLKTGGAITSDQVGTGFLQLDTDTGALEGIAVTALTNTLNGVWEYSLNNGSSWISFGSVSTSAARLLSSGDLVRFRPNQNFSGNVSMTFVAWDRTSGTDGSLANVSTRGGQTAFSAVSQTATLAVNIVNEPPSFGLSSNTTTIENNTVAASGGVPGTGSNANQITVPNFAFGITSGPAGQPPQTVTFFVSTDRPDLFATDPNTDLPEVSIDGTASATPGTLRYTLAKDVFGVATLSVYAENSGGGNNKSITQFATITINGINDPPTLDAITNQGPILEGTTPPSVPLTGITAGLNESQNISITAVATPQPGDNASLISNVQVSYNSPNTTGTLSYSLTPGQAGTEQITVTVKDDGSGTQGGVNTFTESFVVTVNSNAPTATPQVVTTLENTPTSPPIVLSGTDPTGKSLSAVISSLPTGGTLYQVTAAGAQGLAITAVNTPVTNASNKVIYAPNSGASGAPYDSFGYYMTEINGPLSSPPANVTIYVTPVNQAPSFNVGPNQTAIVGAGAQTVANWVTQISSGAANGSNQSLTFIVTQTGGSIGLFNAGPSVDSSGTLTYTPSGATGTSNFSIVLEDTTDGMTSAAQNFSITVSAVPPAPLAKSYTFVLGGSGPSTGSGQFSVLFNDVSQDGQQASLRAVLIGNPSNGTVTLNPDGSFTYTPLPGFQGFDQFTYEAKEGTSTSSPTTVTVLSQQASIVDKLYNQVLGRSPDIGGLEFWTSQVMGGASYSTVAQGIFDSTERLNAIIGGGQLGSITYPGFYPQYLLRQADPAGLAYWVGVWQADGGPDNVIAGMIGSPEFYTSAGLQHPSLSANAAWVTSLYERLLSREPDSGGLQHWTSNLDNGTMTRQQVVLGFVRSPENFQQLTTAFFQEYLLRLPTVAEVNQYVAQFQAGATQSDVQEAIINLPEYANTPPAPAAGTVGRSLYLF